MIKKLWYSQGPLSSGLNATYEDVVDLSQLTIIVIYLNALYLFLIYLNDFWSCINNNKAFYSSDDNNVIFSKLRKALNKLIINISNWLCANILSLTVKNRTTHGQINSLCSLTPCWIYRNNDWFEASLEKHIFELTKIIKQDNRTAT